MIATATHWLPATDTRPAEPAPDVMTVEETARFLRLGNGCPERTLRRYRRTGLRAIQIGRDVRYRLSDVVAWLDEQQRRNPR